MPESGNHDHQAAPEKSDNKIEQASVNERGTRDGLRITSLGLFLVFFKVGTFTIGGGYAMLPLIQDEFINRKRWIDTQDFLDILVLTQSFPGPLIINFALLAGNRLKGFKGGLFALLGAVLPSFLIILIIAAYLWQFGANRAVQAAFQGIRPVVVALILAAAFKLGKNILQRRCMLLLFLLSLGVLLALRIHPVVVIAGGALAGLLRPFLLKTKQKDTEN